MTSLRRRIAVVQGFFFPFCVRAWRSVAPIARLLWPWLAAAAAAAAVAGPIVCVDFVKMRKGLVSISSSSHWRRCFGKLWCKGLSHDRKVFFFICFRCLVVCLNGEIVQSWVCLVANDLLRGKLFTLTSFSCNRIERTIMTWITDHMAFPTDFCSMLSSCQVACCHGNNALHSSLYFFCIFLQPCYSTSLLSASSYNDALNRNAGVLFFLSLLFKTFRLSSQRYKPVKKKHCSKANFVSALL